MTSQNIDLNKRQKCILQYVSTAESAVSVGDILEDREVDTSDVSRITIVRDLALLTNSGLLVREGAGRGVGYRVSPGFSLTKQIDTDKYFEAAQDDRSIFRTFKFDIFPLLASVSVFSPAERKHLNALHMVAQERMQQVTSKTMYARELERIMIEFSWKSSQIEGNTYSLLDTEALLKDNTTAVGKTAMETQMILNHKTTFAFIVEHSHSFTKMSRALVEHVHSLLVADLNITKNLRKTAVGIVGTNYRPLDNQFQIEEAISAYVKLVNSKQDFFEKAFLSLVLLSYIQAFEDGNKRTARLVSNAMLLANNAVPMSYRAVNEVEYKKATILFYELNNLSYFKQLFIEQFEFAVQNYFL
jgi:hypothetical protein